MSEQDFRFTFSQYGELKEAYISKQIRASHQMKVSSFFGFVTFQDPQIAQDLLDTQFVQIHPSIQRKLDIPDFREIKQLEWAERKKKDPHFKKSSRLAFKNIPQKGFFLVKPFNVKMTNEKGNGRVKKNANSRANNKAKSRKERVARPNQRQEFTGSGNSKFDSYEDENYHTRAQTRAFPMKETIRINSSSRRTILEYPDTTNMESHHFGYSKPSQQNRTIPYYQRPSQNFAPESQPFEHGYYRNTQQDQFTQQGQFTQHCHYSECLEAVRLNHRLSNLKFTVALPRDKVKQEIVFAHDQNMARRKYPSYEF